MKSYNKLNLSLSFNWAVNIITALFLCNIVYATTEDGQLVAEVIKESENLLLEKKRAESTQRLIKFLEANNLRKAQREKILLKIAQLSEIFMGESAQKFYEQGNSLALSKPERALSIYEQALLEEPNNVLVLQAMARIQNKIGSCKKALDSIEIALAMNPMSEVSALIKLRALDCSGDHLESKAYFNDNKQLLPIKNVEVLVSHIKWQIDNGELKLAETTARNCIVLDANFPDCKYLLWKILISENREAVEDAKNYISNCKVSSPQVVSNYPNSWEMCEAKKEVEAYVEKNEQEKPTN